MHSSYVRISRNGKVFLAANFDRCFGRHLPMRLKIGSLIGAMLERLPVLTCAASARRSRIRSSPSGEGLLALLLLCGRSPIPSAARPLSLSCLLRRLLCEPLRAQTTSWCSTWEPHHWGVPSLVTPLALTIVRVVCVSLVRVLLLWSSSG